jgi:ABC-2 type transport system permease protein
MQQLVYMLKKEFKQIFRTKEMIGIIFGIPLIQMIVLGFAITTDVKNIDLMVADFDKSKTSRKIIKAFEHTKEFNLIGYANNVTEIEESIQNWEAKIGLVFPKDFSKEFILNQKPQIQILVDGVNGNTAGVSLGYAQGVLNKFAQKELKIPTKSQILRNVHLVQSEDRMWYNLNLESVQFMVPGIIAVLLTVITMMLSAMSLVREKEIGTLEQLMVTPLTRLQLLFGKILPFLILAFIEAAFVTFWARIIFGVEVQGSYMVLALLAFIYLFTTLGLGIFVSTITTTQQQAMFVAWFIMVFTLLMSGFFIPIENMPILLQYTTYLNPMRYFMYIIRDVIQKGADLQYILKDVIPMTIYGLVIFIFSVLKFQKRVA